MVPKQIFLLLLYLTGQSTDIDVNCFTVFKNSHQRNIHSDLQCRDVVFVCCWEHFVGFSTCPPQAVNHGIKIKKG